MREAADDMRAIQIAPKRASYRVNLALFECGRIRQR
jgi:hypothetical protein